MLPRAVPDKLTHKPNVTTTETRTKTCKARMEQTATPTVTKNCGSLSPR